MDTTQVDAADREARRERFLKLRFEEGMSLLRIGQLEDPPLSRERVRQIINSPGLVGAADGRSRVERNKLEAEVVALMKLGETPGQIAEALGQRYHYVRLIMKRNGWQPEYAVLASQGLRRCQGVCKQVKPLTEFPNASTDKHGRGSRCNVCNRANAREQYARRKAVSAQILADEGVDHE